MIKRAVLIFSCAVISASCLLFSAPETVRAGSLSSFSYSGSMTYDVLSSYMSRAVTLEGFCVQGINENLIFEEDLRMLQRTGAKFVAGAAKTGDEVLSAKQMETHFSLAAEYADKVHNADSEIILQAYLPVTHNRDTVNGTSIPSWVFEAFNKAYESRNFNFDSMIFPDESEYKTSGDNSILYIATPEAQMYLYYYICRYIDAGYESVHLGQAVSMMNDNSTNAGSLKTVLERCRNYAKTKLKRKIILFDCDTTSAIPVIKSGNELVTDIISTRLYPAETKIEGVAFKADISINQSYSVAGSHPLGFEVTAAPVFYKFENYSYTGSPGTSNNTIAGCWGFNDITWFALQPESYRNEFLNNCHSFFKENGKDSQGNQICFIQMPCKVSVTESDAPQMQVNYTPTVCFNEYFFNDYVTLEENSADYSKGVYSIIVRKYYHANRNTDGCPNGFSQEDIIRILFLGSNVKENAQFNTIIIPKKYFASTTEDNSFQYTNNSSSESGKATNSSGSKSKTSTSSKASSNGKSSSSGSKQTTSESNDDSLNINSGSTSLDRYSPGSSYSSSASLIILPKNNIFGIVIFLLLIASSIAAVIYFFIIKKKM